MRESNSTARLGAMAMPAATWPAGAKNLEDLQESGLALRRAVVARRHAQVGGVKQMTVMLICTPTWTPSVPKLKSHEATSSVLRLSEFR